MEKIKEMHQEVKEFIAAHSEIQAPQNIAIKLSVLDFLDILDELVDLGKRIENIRKNLNELSAHVHEKETQNEEA